MKLEWGLEKDNYIEDYIDKFVRIKDDYIDKFVRIKDSDKKSYKRDGIIGKEGTVIKVHEKFNGVSIGVSIDDEYNTASADGTYWFCEEELEIIERKEAKEMETIKKFEHVAIVNLWDDYHKKDYAFALYDDDMDVIINLKEQNHPAMAIINAKGKDNRVLGTIKDIYNAEDYFDAHKHIKITAEVVGIVNMDGYYNREAEKERLKKLAEKKAAIEKELEAEINKRKSVEYYEEMAKKYSDNPKLAELVAELKEINM